MTEHTAFLLLIAGLSGLVIVALRGWWLAIAEARRMADEFERADALVAAIARRRA